MIDVIGRPFSHSASTATTIVTVTFLVGNQVVRVIENLYFTVTTTEWSE